MQTLRNFFQDITDVRAASVPVIELRPSKRRKRRKTLRINLKHPRQLRRVLLLSVKVSTINLLLIIEMTPTCRAVSHL